MSAIDLLVAALALPLVGLVFVVAMPATDRVTIRHVAMGASILSGLALLAALRAHAEAGTPAFGALALPLVDGTFALSLTSERVFAGIALAFTGPIALRAGAPRVSHAAKAYAALVLVVIVSLLAALLAARPTDGLLALSFSTLPLMLLVGLFGGPHKGTVALQRAVMVLVADACALAALHVEAPALEPVAPLLVALPLLVRAGVFPLGSVVADLIDQANVTVIALERAAVLPVAATWWVTARAGEGSPVVMQALLVAVLLGVALAVCNALVERDLLRFVADVALVADGPALVALLFVDEAAPVALAAFALMGGATASASFAIDAMERRFSTRDSVDLVGTGDQLPGLFRVFALALVTALPAPGLGAGALLPALLVEGARGATAVALAASQPASVGLFVALGLSLAIALTGVAASIHLRRIVSPARGSLRVPPAFRAGHAARLWFPAFLVVALGVFAAVRVPLRAGTPVVDQGGAP